MWSRLVELHSGQKLVHQTQGEIKFVNQQVSKLSTKLHRVRKKEKEKSEIDGETTKHESENKRN